MQLCVVCDRTGQYNTMSAEVKVVDADTLDKALGMAGLSIKDIGEKLLGRCFLYFASES